MKSRESYIQLAETRMNDSHLFSIDSRAYGNLIAEAQTYLMLANLADAPLDDHKKSAKKKPAEVHVEWNQHDQAYVVLCSKHEDVGSGTTRQTAGKVRAQHLRNAHDTCIEGEQP